MKTKTIQMAIRILGLVQLILGIVFWTGDIEFLVICHILLGSLLTIGLFALVFRAHRSGVSKWAIIISAVWAIGLPLYGLIQEKILPGSYHWVAEVLHLLCGVGAVGVGEFLAAAINRKNK